MPSRSRRFEDGIRIIIIVQWWWTKKIIQQHRRCCFDEDEETPLITLAQFKHDTSTEHHKRDETMDDLIRAPLQSRQ